MTCPRVQLSRFAVTLGLIALADVQLQTANAKRLDITNSKKLKRMVLNSDLQKEQVHANVAVRAPGGHASSQGLKHRDWFPDLRANAQQGFKKAKQAVDHIQSPKVHDQADKAFRGAWEQAQAFAGEASAGAQAFTTGAQDFASKASAGTQAFTTGAQDLASEAAAAAEKHGVKEHLQGAAGGVGAFGRGVFTAATNPEVKQKLRDTETAMDRAVALAYTVTDVYNEPDVRNNLRGAALKAFKFAEALAEPAAAAADDPRVKKLGDAARNVMQVAQSLAYHTGATLNDAKVEQILNDAAVTSLEVGQAAARKARKVAPDKEVQEQVAEAAKRLLELVKSTADSMDEVAQMIQDI